MTRLPDGEANSRPALSLDTCQPSRAGSAPTTRQGRGLLPDLGVAVARNAIRMGDGRSVGSGAAGRNWRCGRLPRECPLLMLAEHGRDAVLGG